MSFTSDLPIPDFAVAAKAKNLSTAAGTSCSFTPLPVASSSSSSSLPGISSFDQFKFQGPSNSSILAPHPLQRIEEGASLPGVSFFNQEASSSSMLTPHPLRRKEMASPLGTVRVPMKAAYLKGPNQTSSERPLLSKKASDFLMWLREEKDRCDIFMFPNLNKYTIAYLVAVCELYLGFCKMQNIKFKTNDFVHFTRMVVPITAALQPEHIERFVVLYHMHIQKAL